MTEHLYSINDAVITGELQSTSALGTEVRFTHTLGRTERMYVVLFTVFYVTVSALFVILLLTSLELAAGSSALYILGTATFVALLTIELIRIFMGLSIAVFTLLAQDPVPLHPPQGLRVAVLTTIVPSKEPLEVVERTLAAMKQIRYESGTVDVWILDEGDDVDVRNMAERLGVYHFTRKGTDKYNQASGAYRAKSKAGNHNAWRAEYEQHYDIVAQMDPDHVPFPVFLERTLGYFHDPHVGFVVAPQVYGNQSTNFIACASAEQAYIFHGIIQRAGNTYGTPLLIGTNHLYRTKAWKQIEGYQDSVIEDHLTSIRLHGTSHLETGLCWKGVYVPDILSIGEGPTTWSDYFNQQKRWAYGVCEIVLQHNKHHMPSMSPLRRLHYIALQAFYPSVAITWILSLFISATTLILGLSFLNGDARVLLGLWACGFASQILFYVWLMRFNLNEHERATSGLSAMLLTLLVAPIYTAGAIEALLRKPLTYAVTAKGNLRTATTLTTYKCHLIWAAAYVPIVLIGFSLHRFAYGSLYWSIITLCTVVSLPMLFLVGKLKRSIYVHTFSIIIQKLQGNYTNNYTLVKRW